MADQIENPSAVSGSASAGAAASPLAAVDDGAISYYLQPGSLLKDHIYARSRACFAAGDATRDAVQSREAVRARQRVLRRSLLTSVGGLPSSETPLNARVTGTVTGRNFRIEKVIFEARPRHYVTAHLYLPARRERRTAAVQFLCGHHAAAKAHPEYQFVCQTLANAGLIVLAQDPLGQGERLSYFDPAENRALVPACTRDHDTAGAQCRFLGGALARYFLHDAMRGIDYLLTRLEVDPARIGVTGNSGGGTQTSLMMIADERIAAAAPGTFIMSRESFQATGQAQDAEQIWPGFSRAGFDHEDILLALAPKPVGVLAVTSDFFPIEGTRRTVGRARRIWELFGEGGRLELVEDQAAHAYTAPLARAAARFFAQHLLGREAPDAPDAPVPFAAETLSCTRCGQVRAEFADARFVFDETAAELAEAERIRSARAAGARRTAAAAWLRDEVFRDRVGIDANLRVIERAKRCGALEADTGFWWSLPGLANTGVLIRAAGGAVARDVTIAVWDDGARAIGRHAGWIEQECAAGRAVLVPSVSGTGSLAPDAINRGGMDGFYGTWHKLADDLDWIGDSLVALRTYEVLRALQVVRD
ncbi:MAG TPA: hypothetical protein VHE13_02725, partial [Opitutus sp.]|nr:hypothetical protein [Opitutus sp.]